MKKLRLLLTIERILNKSLQCVTPRLQLIKFQWLHQDKDKSYHRDSIIAQATMWEL